MKRTESDVKRAIVKFLNYSHIFAWSNPRTGIPKGGTGKFIPLGLNGVCDIIACLPDGRFLGVEAKKEGGKLSKAQENFIVRINENKGLIFVAHSVDEVERKLKEAGYLGGNF